jgi:DNA-directed RNA polymerase subunit beta'
VKDGEHVKLGQLLAEWDPYTYAILTEIGGTVQFKDLQEGITLNEEVDEVTGLSRWVVPTRPMRSGSRPSWSRTPRRTSATCCLAALT